MSDLFGHDPDSKWDGLRAGIDALMDKRPVGGWPLILADHPWLFGLRSKKGEGKSPQRHYECVPMPVLKALNIGRLASANATMLLWATSPLLDQQIECLKGYGFRWNGVAPWFKGSPRSEGDDCEDEGWNPAFAGGYVFRNCAEFLLIGTRGNPVLKPERRSVRGAFFNPQREHSRKPDEQYTHAESLSDGPYLELFSRTDRPGWTSFGNETGRWQSGEQQNGHQ